MRRRIFIAINLPEEIKEKLLSFQSKWPQLPCRWAKIENLHITLVFLGYIKENELPKVLEIAKEVSANYRPFSINLKKVCYGPIDRKPPRMVWAVGELPEELRKLQKELAKKYFDSKIDQLKKEKRPFTVHITLGRLRQWEFRRMEPEEMPQINEEINLSFQVNSIEVMESRLKRGGAEYTTIERAELNSQHFE